MLEISKCKQLQRIFFSLLVFISLLTLSAHNHFADCQNLPKTSDIATSSKLFSDLTTGGTIFRHILSYVESGRNFLASSKQTNNETTTTTTTTTTSSTTTTASASTEDATASEGKGVKSSWFPVPAIRTTIKASSQPAASMSKQRDPLKEELQLRLEFIKMKILHKLGLNKAPQVKTRKDHEAYTQLLELKQLHSNPNPYQDNGMDSSASNEESDKLFLLPTKSGPNGATFNLTLDTEIHRYPVKKVSMFTKMKSLGYWDNDISLMLLKTGAGVNSSYESFLGKTRPINEDKRNPLRYHENILHGDLEWREYDLTSLVSDALPLNPQLDHHRLIVVDTESKKLHSSFITIEFDYISAPRKRRRIDCNSAGNSSSCCRESFYVNFTQIGWDNWIVQPPGYYANYCKGKCDISHARYHHTTVVQKYSSIINLCCSPREMSNISLIYVNESGYLFQKNLANMVVESCDCA